MTITQIFILFGFLMFLIFLIPAYFILLPFMREPRWNREIETIAKERGLTHERQAALPDYLSNLDFSILAQKRPKTVFHLLHGFADGVEMTVFYFKYYGPLTSTSSTFWHVTVIALRKSASDTPVVFSQTALDYVEPEKLRAFIDKGLQEFKQSLLLPR
ncbi:MAG: hypothetical protein ACR2N3_05605 [Pyrinomonadaceae bacterium]